MQIIKKRLNSVKGYEDFNEHYIVLSNGKVIIEEYVSIDKNGVKRTIKERECKISYDSYGKGKVSLRKKNETSTTRLISYIIGNTFIENPNNYKVITHIDGDNTNNSIDNLCWITANNNPAFDTIANLDGEEWKNIKDFPIYMASNKGRIKSIARDVKQSDGVYIAKPAYLITPTLEERSGYLSVGLTNEGRIFTKRVHRLVAETFIPNPDSKPQVDHIDQNKLNNSVNNLRWVSSKENNQNGGTSPVVVTYPNGNVIEYNSVIEAAEATGYAPGSITTHCSRRSKPSNGYSFRWKDQKRKLGQQNKRKGNAFELEVVHKLNEIGYNTVTSRSESKRADDNKIDIIDLDQILPINIQTKYTSTTPNYFNIRSLCKDEKPFCIIWKKSVSGENSPGTVAIIPVNFLYEMLKMYKQNIKKKDD